MLKCIEKLKDLHNTHSHIYHLDFTVNILLYLLYPLSVLYVVSICFFWGGEMNKKLFYKPSLRFWGCSLLQHNLAFPDPHLGNPDHLLSFSAEDSKVKLLQKEKSNGLKLVLRNHFLPEKVRSHNVD